MCGLLSVLMDLTLKVIVIQRKRHRSSFYCRLMISGSFRVVDLLDHDDNLRQFYYMIRMFCYGKNNSKQRYY